MIRGLLKKKTLFQTTYEPNVGKQERLIDGIIYKIKPNSIFKKEIEKLSDIPDVEFELAQVSGQAIDKPVIQNTSYSDWKGI